ncbi:hypothetical protein SDC9_204424 [bioreactor metagenome]|uniref:Uncharacterized protein n=1 Tax=bioreactor metagenome TaxID=1076179 RepID=A0A645J0W4_9ZZZZ
MSIYKILGYGRHCGAIGNRYFLITPDDNSLELFTAHQRAEAVTAVSMAQIIDYAGVAHQIFTCGADDGHFCFMADFSLDQIIGLACF